jgi:putative transposase
MEDLKGIRKRINYGRMLNRRLHSWNFRRLQFYVEYKAKLEGLRVVYVSPRGTSSLCPFSANLPPHTWHRRIKCKCG